MALQTREAFGRWHDAVRSDYLRKVMKGEIEGDHGKAVDEFRALLAYHVDFDRLRAIFMPDLRVGPGYSALFGRWKFDAH